MVRGFAIAGIAVVLLLAAEARSDSSNRIVVLVDSVGGKPKIKIEGHVVEYRDLLSALNAQKRSAAPGTRVHVVAHEETALRTIDDLRGLTMKAGLPGPRVFYFAADRRLMVEITYGVAIRYDER